MKNETKIGLMVVLCVIFLGYLTWSTGNFNFAKEGYDVKVRFRNIDGVNENSPVMYNGFEVGTVKDISIIDGSDEIFMELSITLDQEARLRQGSVAMVKNLGLMGEKYVSLSSGEKSAPYIGEGSTIMGVEPADFDQLVGDGAEIAEELKAVAKDIKEITANLNERLKVNKGSIDKIVSNLDQTMTDLRSVAALAEERLKVNSPNIDEIVGNLNGLSQNLEEMSYDLKLHPWKLLYKGKDKKKEKVAGD